MTTILSLLTQWYAFWSARSFGYTFATIMLMLASGTVLALVILIFNSLFDGKVKENKKTSEEGET